MLYPAELQPLQYPAVYCRRQYTAVFGAGGIRSPALTSCSRLRPAYAFFRRHPCRLFLPPVGEGFVSNPHRHGLFIPVFEVQYQTGSTLPFSEQGGFGLRRSLRVRASDPPTPSFGGIPAASSSLRSAKASFRIPTVTGFLYPYSKFSIKPAVHCRFRSRGDSNPRYPFGAQLLSREPDSATLAPLLELFWNRRSLQRSEQGGFEPPEPSQAQRFSRPPPSTTRTPLQIDTIK